MFFILLSSCEEFTAGNPDRRHVLPERVFIRPGTVAVSQADRDLVRQAKIGGIELF